MANLTVNGDLDRLFSEGSLAELFEVGEVVTKTTTDFVLVYEHDDGSEETLTLTGTFGGYNGGDYPTTGTITAGAWNIEGGPSLSFSNISISVEEFTGFVGQDAIQALFEALLAQDDTISGASGDDVLYGFAGNDLLIGGAGADTMVGGTGDDTYHINGTDTVVEFAGQGIDTIESFAEIKLGNNLENATLTGLGAWSITGNAASNILRGNGSSNTIHGLGGDDELYGGYGSDELIGGSGSDRLYGENDSDFIDGGDGIDWAFFAGDFESYEVSVNSEGVVTVLSNLVSDFGFVDTVVNVENFSFNGTVYSLDQLPKKDTCVLDLDGDGIASEIEIQQSAIYDLIFEGSREQEALIDEIFYVQNYIRSLTSEADLQNAEQILQVVSGIGGLLKDFLPPNAQVGIEIAGVVADLLVYLQDPSTKDDIITKLLLQLYGEANVFLGSPSNLVEAAAKANDLFDTLSSIVDVRGRLTEIDELLILYNEKLEAAQQKLEQLEANLNGLYECLDVEGNSGSAMAARAGVVQASGAIAQSNNSIVPITLEELPPGLFLAAGTQSADVVDTTASSVINSDSVFLIESGAGDDRINVTDGNVYIFDSEGVDRVTVLDASGVKVSIDDIIDLSLTEGIVQLSVAQSLYVAAEGVEHFEFSEGIYSLSGGQFVFVENEVPSTSLAKLILTEFGQDVTIGGNVSVAGTTSGGEIIEITRGNVVLDGSFNAGGDTVVLPGHAGTFSANLSGSFVTIKNEDVSVAIPVGTVGLAVHFADSTRRLCQTNVAAGAEAC